MADGMPGMPWKEALKRLKEYHCAGADGSPASMQKELEGLEESLKGWETRDERRERALEVYRQDAFNLRVDAAVAQKLIDALQKALELATPVLYGRADELLRKGAIEALRECARLSGGCLCSEDAGGLGIPFRRARSTGPRTIFSE